MAREPRPASKAGRNEGRKLFAAMLNNIATALILAGILQPALGVFRQGQPFGWRDASASLVLFIFWLIFLVAAQSVVRRLED